MKIDMLLVHGWGMNSAVWRPCLQRLPDWIEPVCIDLPGSGLSAAARASTLEEYVAYVAQQISRPTVLMGWSLGGLVTLQLARRFPEKVTALVQVASTPKFVQDRNWRTAIDAEIFEQFAASLEKEPDRTIRRFLALQVRGAESSMQTVRELQRAIDERGLPAVDALCAGLKILSDTDLTGAVQQLDCAISWLLGDRDMLVPVGLAGELRTMLPDPDIRIIEGAGHAPFISHPDDFMDALVQVLERS